jgi:REP element-mobilizing transposase RayT
MASTYHLIGLGSLMTLFQAKYRIESTRFQDWDCRSRGWYFVTICTQRRRSILGRIAQDEVQLSPIGLIADSELRTLHNHYRNVQVDEHIVMPNHVHAIFMIDGEHCFSPDSGATVPHRFKTSFTSPQAGSLSAIVRSYKAGVTVKCRELAIQQTIWQPRFYDHLLRGDKVISAVREYIRNNPADWPKDIENRL